MQVPVPRIFHPRMTESITVAEVDELKFVNTLVELTYPVLFFSKNTPKPLGSVQWPSENIEDEIWSSGDRKDGVAVVAPSPHDAQSIVGSLSALFPSMHRNVMFFPEQKWEGLKQLFPWLLESLDSDSTSFPIYPSVILLPSSSHGALFLSSQLCAQDSATLSALKISHIVNCCGSSYSLSSNRLVLPLVDSYKQVLSDALVSSGEWIEEKLNSGHNVLVHCEAGISRSTSIVIAYLILKKGMDPQNALEYVQNLRSVARPNSGFLAQLMSLK